MGNLTLFPCRLLGKTTCSAPLICSASKAARFRVGREGVESADMSATTKVSLDCTLLSQTLTWSEILVCFRCDESPRSKEPLVYVLVVEFLG